jgi:translation initiation factor 1
MMLSIMAEICPTCGLPRDICVCEEIGKEQQRIRVRLETRKWGKAVTIVDGITEKEADLSRLAQKLKSFCACGGTAKNDEIILQGDHRDKVREYLIREGYPKENVEVQ